MDWNNFENDQKFLSLMSEYGRKMYVEEQFF